jgi:hypothetical protein
MRERRGWPAGKNEMPLADRDYREWRLMGQDTDSGNLGCALLVLSGASWFFAVGEALQWKPDVLWYLAAANVLGLAAAEVIRHRNITRARIAEDIDMDDEHGPEMNGLRLNTALTYRNLAVFHGISAVFLGSYYGARILKRAVPTGPTALAYITVLALVLLAALAYWRRKSASVR